MEQQAEYKTATGKTMQTKFSVTTTKTEQVEREIELPYFFKHVYNSIGNVYYAVFDEKRCMRVHQGCAIGCELSTEAVLKSSLVAKNFAESNEEEFNAAFEETIEALAQMLPQHT